MSFCSKSLILSTKRKQGGTLHARQSSEEEADSKQFMSLQEFHVPQSSEV